MMTDFHHLRHEKQQIKSRRTLWFTLIVTLMFAILEIIGGILSNSLALLSDSAHMVSDVIALSLSLTAIYFASRPPNSKYTFGFLRFEIIASFLNGLALCIIAVGIFLEGVRRVFNPEPVDLQIMLTIASIGLLVNIVLTIVLSRSIKDENNLNVRSALWHFIGDLLSSLGVIVAGILIWLTSYVWLDPIISLVIGGIIFTGGAKITRESYVILMETVPNGFDLEQIRKDILAVEGVEDVHEMHLWAISSDHYSLTAHVFSNNNIQPFCIILGINDTLEQKYGITHSTIQIEHAIVHPHGEYGKNFLKQQTSISNK